jgi:hypothetical protein
MVSVVKRNYGFKILVVTRQCGRVHCGHEALKLLAKKLAVKHPPVWRIESEGWFFATFAKGVSPSLLQRSALILSRYGASQPGSGVSGGQPPAPPTLTAEERHQLSQQVKPLSEILQPARERGPELEFEVGKLFAGFNVYTGDEAKLKLQIAAWCEELEEFPLFAIRRACRWSVRGCQKLPSLAAFIADVRLAIGPGVLERRRLLGRLAA